MATKGVIDQILPAVVEMMPSLVKMGDPRSPETKMVGPVISESAAEGIEKSINESVAEGAKVVMGGKRDHAFIEPTILSNVKPTMSVVAKEIFGPVLSFIALESMEEIAKIVNESRFGLQACVFTKDEGTGLVFAQNLNVGTIQINGSPQRGPDHFPFLGVKSSGVGTQGVRYSLEAMSRLKSIVINKPQ
jgi:glyceraldehyde-3-phosphate dehydrogenase (NADP+)